jgi:hypothetical protein
MDGQQPGGMPLNVKLSDARDINCECGNAVFMEGFRFKKVSRLVTGGAKDAVLPIQLYLCTQCGKALQELLPEEMKDKPTE